MPLSPTMMRSAGTSGASRSVIASVVSKVLRSRLLMPISRDFKLQRALEFGLVMHLDQHVHAERERRVFERSRPSRRRRRHDDQDAVGAPGARLDHLIGLEHEILAQRGQRGRGARGGEEFRRALEDGASVSTERQAAPPAS